MDEIQKILKGQDKQKILSVFSFSANDNEELIATKYDLFVRFFFPGIFLSDDAPFHREMILNTILAYQGKLDAFVNIAFRGAAKDAKTKPFVVFVILNDRDHYRRYIRVLSADLDNAVQFTTDIYNGLVSPRILQFYPHTFGGDKNLKRMERMGNFDTSASIKVEADSVGTGQRGKSQDIETMRPDFIVFNDIETRDTLWSAITTKKIADRIEEARTGLQKGGSAIYLANYISEMGNVHKLIKNKLSPRKKVLIIPIINDNGEITWNRYTLADIEEMKRTDDDFAGERLCKPSATKDVFFDREILENMPQYRPHKIISDFKIFYEYNPSHRYAGGHDVAGGVGLDSSTSVFIDFSTVPNRVVATYRSNSIKPDIFGDEIARQGELYGLCLLAPESNNYGIGVITRLRQIYDNIFIMEWLTGNKINEQKNNTYGWQTNTATKSTMLMGLRKAVEDGHLELTDPEIIDELKSYTRNDLMDKDIDVRMATRHYDLLIATAIAWQMKNYAEIHSRPQEADTGQTTQAFDVY